MNKLKISEISNIITAVNVVIDRIAYEGFEVKRRTIADHELVFIVGGNGSVYINDSIHKANPGTLFYFYPGLIHSLHKHKNEPLHFLAVHFSFKTPYDSFDNGILPIEPISKITNTRKIHEIFYKLYKVWQQKEYGWRWQQNIILERMLFELFLDIYSIPENHMNCKRMEHVLRYIENNYMNKITVKELSTLLKISEGYLNEIFKLYTGKPPLEYINAFRIDKSKELLLNTSMKINEVAAGSGFQDPLYYSRIFSKYEFCTPSEYRKKYII